MKDFGNAAVRETICSEIYELGVKQKKQQVLSYLGEELASLHNQCFLHIHDMDTFGEVYNCSTPRLYEYLQGHLEPQGDISFLIFEVFSLQKQLITQLGTNQSGGIGFADYDVVLSRVLDERGIALDETTEAALTYCLRDFVHWINTDRTRCCREPYYLTFNVGLATSAWGRKVTEVFLREFMAMPTEFTRPNIVFKVKRELHLDEHAPNRDLFLKALECTGRRMIPTYLLLDSEVNREFAPESIGIMGCRTRVAANVNGPNGTIGRGNIGNVSINLPRLALMSGSYDLFAKNLNTMLEKSLEILRKREDLVRQSAGKYVDYVLQEHLWENVSSVDEMVRQGSFSIGYIGLSETVEILTSRKYYEDPAAQEMATEIVQTMRDFMDRASARYQRNYTLLASPGELISGRFCEYDAQLFAHEVLEKGYYTNSFHVDVDAGLPVFRKIEQEASFHRISNGGCITYVELKEAVGDNICALEDIVRYALENDLSYLGINFPMDVCETCGSVGTFDTCTRCGSNQIRRIRRVSGYLEDLTHFTSGKKAEEKNRKSNV